MKKIGKAIRSFRYDLNQIPYDYSVEVTNRFKELDLVDRMSEELWTEVPNIVQEVVTETIPKKKKWKKGKGTHSSILTWRIPWTMLHWVTKIWKDDHQMINKFKMVAHVGSG